MWDVKIRVDNEQFKLLMELLTKLDILLKIRYIEKINSNFYYIFLIRINRIEHKAIKNITNTIKNITNTSNGEN